MVDNLAAFCATAASETRPVDPEYAQGQKTMFSDGFPFMLLSQVSHSRNTCTSSLM